MKLKVHTDGLDGSRKRSQELAKKLDRGDQIKPERVITFESEELMFRVLTQARVRLFKTLKQKELSVADLVNTLNRPRTAVIRDVKILAEAGIVKTRRVSNPGHGVMTMVSSVSQKLWLEV